MKSGSAFVSVQQTSFLLPGEFPSSPHPPALSLPFSHAPASGLGLSPTHLETRMCACRGRECVWTGGGRVCRTFIFWHGYPYPRFICSFACLQQQQQQQALVYLLVFHLDATPLPPHYTTVHRVKPTQSQNPAAMLNTCMYIITRAGRAGHVRQLDEGAACMLAGKLFYSVCGCQRQGVAVAYFPLSAPIHRLPFGMPRAHGHDWKSAQSF